MRGGIQLTVALVLTELLLPTAAIRCDRTPEGHVSPKIPADNRFQLKISGSPDKYVPGEGYTISLHGQRNHGQVPQKFTGFMLVVEPLNPTPMRIHSTRDVTPRPVGLFQLYGDTLTKFSPNCPNMVTHTSSMPKPEIQVRWTAPPPGSGCVIFRATIIEHRDVWYQDDGPLSKMLCEELQENQNMQPEVLEYCCACDEAKYEVTFEGLWSRHTHPKDFPSNSWLTRFSDVIGASHSTNYRFWEYGGIASDGLRHVAERGSTRMLESELKSESSNIRTIIKARGISYPNVTGKTFAVFRVDKQHHLMSLVSMIDPSPDWIVGVSALELCLTNCSWIESKVLNLYPWDAGTDSGVTYISPDQQTFPQDKIRQITSSFPNDPRSPFYDSSGADMKPLARLYLTRQRLYEKTCEEEPIPSNGCALSNWSDWGPCSTTCGPGQMYRQRHFLHRGNARNCPKKVKLSDMRYCNSRHCRPTFYPTPESIDSNCEVHEWTDWSRCEPVDKSCRRGIQKRYRLVEPRDNYRSKLCVRVPKEDEQECRLSTSPSVCPKNALDRKIYSDPQESTCCEPEEGEEDLFSDRDGDRGEDGEQDNYGEREGDDQEDLENNEIAGEYPQQEYPEEDIVDENDYTDKEPTGQCTMTQWSVWSPCSVTCGPGIAQRSRRLLNPPEVDGPRAEYQRAEEEGDYGTYDEEAGSPTSGEYAEGPCSLFKVREIKVCNGTFPACQFLPEDAREICGLPPDEGRCPGPFMPRWYYDPKQENCVQFQWSGCRGNNNRFLTQEECRSACQAYTATDPEEELTTEYLTTVDPDLPVRNQHMVDGEEMEGTERPVRNCKFSRWSEWSECDAPCGQEGLKVRTRYIQVHARNGGKDCIGKTRKQKKCVRKCTSNDDDDRQHSRQEEQHPKKEERCEYSEWSEWTECTRTCGYHAMRQRTRQVIAGSPTECHERLHKRLCNVGPCPL